MCGAQSFVEIVNGLKPLIVVAKSSVLNVCLGFEYASYEFHGRELLEEWDCGRLSIVNHVHFAFLCPN